MILPRKYGNSSKRAEKTRSERVKITCIYRLQRNFTLEANQVGFY